MAEHLPTHKERRYWLGLYVGFVLGTGFGAAVATGMALVLGL